MNFNIEDLIKRIEQLEANTVNNASVYELTKTIDKISTRLEGIEALAKGAASSKVFAPIINEIKNEIETTKGSISNLAKLIKPPVIPKTYDNEIAKINSAISKAKEELSNSLLELAKTIKPPIVPKTYDNEIASLKEAVFGVKESIKSQAKEVLSLDSKLKETIKPIEKIEQVVDSARRTYGEELSSFTLKTNKKLDAINEIIGVNNGE